MKAVADILRRWRHHDPDRLLQAALQQAQQLAEIVPEMGRLRAQNLLLSEKVEVQTKRIAQLQEGLQTFQRAAHRQAAPFRKPEHKRVAEPKTPGRKIGHPDAFRQRPATIDQSIEVPLCECPHCGGKRFSDQTQIQQLIEDIPPVRPRVTQLTTYEAICMQCNALRGCVPASLGGCRSAGHGP
jgi:hypothetical protein